MLEMIWDILTYSHHNFDVSLAIPGLGLATGLIGGIGKGIASFIDRGARKRLRVTGTRWSPYGTKAPGREKGSAIEEAIGGATKGFVLGDDLSKRFGGAPESELGKSIAGFDVGGALSKGVGMLGGQAQPAAPRGVSLLGQQPAIASPQMPGALRKPVTANQVGALDVGQMLGSGYSGNFGSSYGKRRS